MNELTERFKAAYESPVINIGRKSTSFHPSATSIKIKNQFNEEVIIGSCLRESWYRIKTDGVSNTGNPDYGISADIGEKLHQLIEQYIDLYGYKMGLQKIAAESAVLDPEINLSGRSDLLVWDHNNNELIGIEVKSLGEFKAGKCAESPDPQHVMQSMLYLDWYQRNIPDHMPKPTKWYIWYISRTENWTIKSKKHGSPLQMLWDYHITLDDKGVPTVYTANGIERWEDFTLSGIKDRYADLDYYVSENIIPPRDFEIEYSEERIVTLYKNGQITRKTDKAKIEKWLDKGAEEGKLGITMGDFQCQFCAWKDHCWKGYNTQKPEQFNFPVKAPKTPNKPSNSDLIL